MGTVTSWWRVVMVLFVPATLMVTGCSGSGSEQGNEEIPMTLTLSSSAFEGDGTIPIKHTCDGNDISPPLNWSGAPDGTQSFALIIDDPDAPDPKAPKRTWVHWVLYNIPVTISELPEGVVDDSLPQGARVGLNDWKRGDYGGPCPPVGRHRYFHKLYALDTVLPDLRNPTKTELEKAMEGHILAQGQLIGTYERPR